MEKKLKKLGLTEYEIRVYLTLLNEGSKKGGEISKLSKVPHGKTYESLESLEKKGFISVFPVKPKLFSAVMPEIAIKNFSNNRIDAIKRLEEDLVKKLKPAKKMTNDARVTDKFTIIHGLKRERELSKYTYDISKKYVKNMSTYEFISSYSRARARKRGVKIFQIATKMTKNLAKNSKEESKEGVDIKYYPLEELRLKIIDGNKSVMTIVNPENSEDRISLFIDSKELSEAFEHYFDKIWKKSEFLHKSQY